MPRVFPDFGDEDDLRRSRELEDEVGDDEEAYRESDLIFDELDEDVEDAENDELFDEEADRDADDLDRLEDEDELECDLCGGPVDDDGYCFDCDDPDA